MSEVVKPGEATNIFERPKGTTWIVIVLVPLTMAGLTLLDLVLFLEPAKAIARATSRAIQPTLTFNVLHLLVVVVGLMFWFGKLRSADVGLIWSKLPAGLFVTVIIWFLLHVISVVTVVAGGKTPSFHPDWSNNGPVELVGILGAQLLGNAFVEEIVFRGFLFPQF